jgi:hypothetical protein
VGREGLGVFAGVCIDRLVAAAFAGHLSRKFSMTSLKVQWKTKMSECSLSWKNFLSVSCNNPLKVRKDHLKDI